MASADEDITHNLPSLQFEAALSDSEKQLLYLRARSHALTVAACAQSAFLVAVLNDARQKIMEKNLPVKKRSSKLLQEAPKRDPVLVGIIGCGRLGRQMANTLLKFSDVQPNELYISTRRPETLSALQSRGAHCGFDNIKVCSTVHLLFICCLPSQFPNIAKEIKGHLRCPVYVLVGGMPFPKVCQLLEFSQVINPVFSWKQPVNTTESFTGWNAEKDINEILRDPVSCDMTCPLNPKKDDALVKTDERWAETVVSLFLNTCTEKGQNKVQTINLCNAIVFGLAPTDDPRDALTRDDIMDIAQLCTVENAIWDDENFPLLDISKVAATQTGLGRRLQSGSLRSMFVKRYRAVFDKFQYWKGVPTSIS